LTYVFLSSFPTRRSSDLHLQIVLLTVLRHMEDSEASVGLLLLPAELVLLPDLSTDPLILPLRELVAHLVHHILQMLFQRFALQLDRKSTRLNSSHVSISY